MKSPTWLFKLLKTNSMETLDIPSNTQIRVLKPLTIIIPTNTGTGLTTHLNREIGLLKINNGIDLKSEIQPNEMIQPNEITQPNITQPNEMIQPNDISSTPDILRETTAVNTCSCPNKAGDGGAPWRSKRVWDAKNKLTLPWRSKRVWDAKNKLTLPLQSILKETITKPKIIRNYKTKLCRYYPKCSKSQCFFAHGSQELIKTVCWNL